MVATTNQLNQYKGLRAMYAPVGTLVFNVRIVDSKVVYGQLRFLIAPVEGAGDGEQWVQSTSVFGMRP